jgi:hypothetical protein
MNSELLPSTRAGAFAVTEREIASQFQGVPLVPAASRCPRCSSGDIWRSSMPTESLGVGDLPGTGEWFRGCLCNCCRKAFFEPFAADTPSLAQGKPREAPVLVGK